MSCTNNSSCKDTSLYLCGGNPGVPVVDTGCAYVKIVNGAINSYWSDSGCTTTGCGGADELTGLSKVLDSVKKALF